MEVLNAANALERSGRAVCHLEAGQPSTKAPKTALDAAALALQSNTLGYTEALGIPQLRERITFPSGPTQASMDHDWDIPTFQRRGGG
jgi:aspartate/methionine/tyrosine aminotransferase